MPIEVSTRGSFADSDRDLVQLKTARAPRSRWCIFGPGQDLADGGGEFIHPGTRHDNRVASAMSFLGNAQELASIVLAELNVEVLALNLELFGLNDVVH